MLREDKETLLHNLDAASRAAYYVMSDYLSEEDVNYLTKLIENDLNG